MSARDCLVITLHSARLSDHKLPFRDEFFNRTLSVNRQCVNHLNALYYCVAYNTWGSVRSCFVSNRMHYNVSHASTCGLSFCDCSSERIDSHHVRRHFRADWLAPCEVSFQMLNCKCEYICCWVVARVELVNLLKEKHLFSRTSCLHWRHLRYWTL
jgi:hypothetical protein